MDSELVVGQLPGEAVCAEITLPTDASTAPAVALMAPTCGVPVPVSFTITSYYVRAIPSATAAASGVRQVVLPLMLIEEAQDGKGRNGTQQYPYTIEMQTKHFWSFVFGFRVAAQHTSALKLLQQLKAVYMSHISRLPAFDLARAAAKANMSAKLRTPSVLLGPGSPTSAVPAPAATSPGATTPTSPMEATEASAAENEPAADAVAAEAVAAGNNDAPLPPADDAEVGMALYDEHAELQRQLCRDPSTPVPESLTDCGVGRDLRPWFQVLHISPGSYGPSPTYPLAIYAPRSVDEATLLRSAEFRGRARLPAISFVHLRSGAVLARAAQPLLRGADAARFDDAAVLRSFLAPYTELSTKTVMQERTVGAKGPSVPVSTTAAPTAGYVPPPSLFDEHAPPMSVVLPPLVGGPAYVDPHANAAKRQLHVMDLRSKIAANGNLAVGGGYETGMHYEFCDVTFLGIENIHAVNASYARVRALINGHAGRKSDARTFYSELEASQWLLHVHRVLRAGVQAAELLDAGESILTHCSDGWDRTAQVSSLAMLLLDPYYRTVDGFMLLIQKEFCDFGHQFAERLGHSAPSDTKPTGVTGLTKDVDGGADAAPPAGTHHTGHKSPIFIQWLDAVYQIWRQFPSHFEFTPALLEVLGVHCFSCLYGTFLGDHQRQRLFDGVTLGTQSLWTAIHYHVEAERREGAADSSPTSADEGGASAAGPIPLMRRVLNPVYDAARAAAALKRPSPNCGLEMLKPSIAVKRLTFWESFYLRYDADRWDLDPCFDAPFVVVIGGAAAAGSSSRPSPAAGLWQAAATRAGAVEAALRAVVGANPNGRDGGSSSSNTGGAGASASPVKPNAADATLLHSAKECWSCRSKFGIFRSMIPCHMCRKPFCGRCAPHQLDPMKHGASVPRTARFCDSCFAISA